MNGGLELLPCKLQYLAFLRCTNSPFTKSIK